MKRREFSAAAAYLGLSFANVGIAEAKQRRPTGGKKTSKPSQPSEPQGLWQELWNGRDLEGWKQHFPAASGETLEESKPSPEQVFQVVQQAGKSLLRVSGHRYGSLVSDTSLRNCQVRVEWRWGQDKWPPRAHLRRSSGLVVHSLPMPAPFGSSKPWLTGLELELQEGSCGDLIIGAGVRLDVPARRERFMGQPLYVFAQSQPAQTLPQPDAEPRVVKSNDYERGYGEWNVADAYLFEQDGAFVINGSMTLQFQNINQVSAEAETPVAEGPVQIVSEGAEIFFRRIAVRPLDKLPDRFRIRKPRG